MKAALISGSSSGIGRAISEKLLDSGIKVIGLARDHSKFKPSKKNYIPVEADLSQVKKLPELIKFILKENSTKTNSIKHQSILIETLSIFVVIGLILIMSR